MQPPPLDETILARLFTSARTQRAWRDLPVDDALLRRVYDLAKYGATSANCSPMRVCFVRSSEAKERLRPALGRGNLAQTMAAPVTAIVAHDMAFADRLPYLHPERDARGWFTSSPAMIEVTAFRNGTLQGAYLMLAARALGLDCGPMSGFDHGKVDAAFFADGTVRSNFLCNLGYGDPAAPGPRQPRLSFDEACTVL